jgi:hypothetical protein
MVHLLCDHGAATRVAAYAWQRWPQDDEGGSQLSTLVVLSLGLFPAGIFLRMAYSESLFLLLTLVSLRAARRRGKSFVMRAAKAVVVGVEGRRNRRSVWRTRH